MINYWLIPDVLNSLPRTFGLNFSLTQLSFGIFGFLLVLVMVLRPQGLFPERRRKLELTAEIAAEDAQLVEETRPKLHRASAMNGRPALMHADHVTKEFGRPRGGFGDVAFDVPLGTRSCR